MILSYLLGKFVLAACPEVLVFTLCISSPLIPVISIPHPGPFLSHLFSLSIPFCDSRARRPAQRCVHFLYRQKACPGCRC